MSLSTSEKNYIMHHFNAKFGINHTSDSQQTVDTAYQKLSTVKSNTIVSIMNSHEDGLEQCSRASVSLLSPPISHEKNPEVGSCAVITVLDGNAMHDQEILPIRAKMAMSIPGSVQQAPELFSEVLSTVLGRTAIWKDAKTLQAKLYSHVYTGTTASAKNTWKPSTDGTSVSMRTPCGLMLKCAVLSSDQSSGSVKNPSESDHRFAQRVLSQGVTQTYSQQPMEFTASIGDNLDSFRAAIYPCSVKSTGLFMGTMHASGHERPMKSCGVITSNTMLVHPKWGVHEADATTLMAPYAKSHVTALSSMFVKSAIMRAVLGNTIPDPDLTLDGMDVPMVVNQYKKLRSTLSPQQVSTSMDMWKGMHAKTGNDANKPLYTVTCVDGTVDCFKNDSSHTGMALHTNNMVHAKFAFDGKEIEIKSPLVVSVYGTYYHPW
jgi:hypothetical protein